MDNEQTKINNIVNILKLNTEDYSEVFILSDLIEKIVSANKLFSQNYIKFSDPSNIFLTKSIICFHHLNGYDFKDFLKEVALMKRVNIDLSKTDIMNFLDCANEVLVNRSLIIGDRLMDYKKGDQKGNDPKLNLMSFTFYLVNTRHFEIFRLIVGDDILKFLFKYTSMFVYEEKLQNFIQITGYNLRDKLLSLLDVKQMLHLNNHLVSSSLSTPKPKKDVKDKIPNPLFKVGRTKIYYCPNFNRNLGLHKTSLKNPRNKDIDTISYLYNRVFDQFTVLPKDQNMEGVERYMRASLATIVDRLKTYRYSHNLFRCCPNKIENWKLKKEEILKQIELSDITGLNKNLIILINEKNTVTYQEVYSFVATFLKDVLPKSFVGWDNFDIILEKLKVFIRMNRYEDFNRTNLFDLKEFSFDSMEIFNHLKMKDKHYRSVGIKLKNFIMKSIIYWVFDYLVVQVIRSHFYVTEKQGDNYKTFYYHKKDWDLVIKINQKKLEVQFKPIDIKDAKKELESKDLTFGRLRLMPKPTSCRPIVSYRRKTLKDKKHLKEIFAESQKVFKYISNKMQSNNDSCVIFDHKTVIKRLLYYKDMLGSDLHELSYHTLDIEACYDNIDIDKLISFLDHDDLISEEYIYNVLYLAMPKANSKGNTSQKESWEVKKLHFVNDRSDYLHFLDFLKNKTDLNYTNCMMYHDFDKHTSTNIKKTNMIRNIKDILNCNIIKFNKKCFKQKKGIPQGLSISSFLCNIYFYNLEKTLSQKICRLVTEKNLLLRFVDDYLLMTKSPQRVSEFIQESIEIGGKNAFNFNFNKSKFNVEYKTKERNESNKFEWNGITFKLNEGNNFNMFIDSKDDYDLKRMGSVINLNVFPNNDGYLWITKKIAGIILTGHPWIYFVSKLNDEDTLRKNFEGLCRVVLYKLILFTRLLAKYKLLPGQKVFNDIITKCLKKFFFYINNKLTKSEERRFFIDDLQTFIETFYKSLYNLYQSDDGIRLIKNSVFLYKCVRRKILSFKIN
jgi:hypothetical protein